MFRVHRAVTGATLLLIGATFALPVRALPARRHSARHRPACQNKAAAASPAGEKTANSVGMTADELRFLELVNHERTSRHLSELMPDPLLVRVAREHSYEMCEKDYFDHLSPTPGERTPMDRYLHAVHTRPAHACVGENLFYCSIVDVDRGHRALMNSPEHRANILYPPFRRSGIGVYKSDTGEFWVTEMFLTTAG